MPDRITIFMLSGILIIFIYRNNHISTTDVIAAPMFEANLWFAVRCSRVTMTQCNTAWHKCDINVVDVTRITEQSEIVGSNGEKVALTLVTL